MAQSSRADLLGRPVTLDEDGITGENPWRASAERDDRQLAVVLDAATARMDAALKEMEINA